MLNGTQPSAPARNRLPTLPGSSLAGGKFQSRSAISAPANAAGSTPSGNQPRMVMAPIRPSIPRNALPQTTPSAPSATRALSARPTRSSPHTMGASTPSSQ